MQPSESRTTSDEVEMDYIEGGGILSVPGLHGSAIATGVQTPPRPDLAVITADQPRACAGVFTQNEFPAAPVSLCRSILQETGCAKSIVINSGNANALTGSSGESDAQAMSAKLAECLGGPALVLSTGVIGEPLPIDKILHGIEMASESVSDSGNDAVARAIMTTDTVPKSCALRVRCSGEDAVSFVVGGVAKGSGMIHPNMATMLAVVATDIPVEQNTLQSLLARCVDDSFNTISVDGDTSTNDTVLLLAGGMNNRSAVLADDPLLDTVEAAVLAVCRNLASRIVRDGEGSQRLMIVTVEEAGTEEEARRVANSVACSSLVKTALAGGDANWGRILSAAGNAGVSLAPESVTLTIGGVPVFENGVCLPQDPEALSREFQSKTVRISLSLGRGNCRAEKITSDLTREYVSINADYRS